MATSQNAWIKKMIRKIIPVRASVFERRHHELTRALSELDANLLKIDSSWRSAIEDSNKRLKEIESALIDFRDTLSEVLEHAQHGSNKINQLGTTAASISSIVNELSKQAKQQLDVACRIESLEREAVWAEIYRQTTSTHSTWLEDTSFSPGRWAVGFPFLYATYRILDEMNPHCILELGLGQSTRMIGQYANYFDSVSHQVVEHDERWIDFWNSSNRSLKSTSVRKLNLTFESFPNVNHTVRRYANFKETLGDHKFDFVSIDAPFGYDMPQLARIDVLDLVPNCLEKSFAIIVDDYNRQGEQNMVAALESLLKKAGIQYERGTYQGEKTTLVIASQDKSFLCTL